MTALSKPPEAGRVDAATRAGSEMPTRPSLRLWSTLGIGILLIASAGYSVTGGARRVAPAVLEEASTGRPVDSATSADDVPVDQVVERMARRLQDRPDDAAGWATVARAYSALGRPAEAVPAFRRAAASKADDAGLLADFADALVAQDNGAISPEAIALVQRALVLEPDNRKAAALAGSIAFDGQDFPTAVRRWEAAARGLPEDSEMLRQVRASIAQARRVGGLDTGTSKPFAGRAKSGL